MTADQIGRLAELIVETAMCRPVSGRGGRPLFRVVGLGEKYPTADFLVDVIDSTGGTVGVFLAQVKGTETPPGRRGRLPIRVKRESFNQLVELPLPTYVVGVDVVREQAFVVAADTARRTQVSSISTAFNLGDDRVKMDLSDEVQGFWDGHRPALRTTLTRTRFHDV